MLLKYDADHNGSVTRAELDAGLHAEFDRYDTGHTGCLNPDQVAAINAERIKQDQSTATPLQDFQDKGCVNFAEYAAAPVSLFEELDRNGDGVVTAEEFNPRPGAGGPRGAAPGGRPPGGGSGGGERRGGNPGP